MSKKRSRKILSDLQKLYPEMAKGDLVHNPISDFKKIFSNSDSRFFVNLPNGDLEEI
jgi:hypothetical protein